MRTLYTLCALISLILVTLVATAQPTATLDVTCDQNSDGTCSTTTANPPTFSGSGLNQHKDYAVVGTSLFNGNFIDVLSSVNKQGNYSESSSDGVLPPDTWTFTLWELDHSGNLNNQLTSPQTLTFE